MGPNIPNMFMPPGVSNSIAGAPGAPPQIAPPAQPPAAPMNIGGAGQALLGMGQAGIADAQKAMAAPSPLGPSTSAAMSSALRGGPQSGQMFNPNAQRPQ